MSVNLIEGLPGAGKSRYATEEIMRELHRGVSVVTNVPLDPAQIRLWWFRKYGEAAEDPTDRLRILETAQIGEFYRYLPKGFLLHKAEAANGHMDFIAERSREDAAVWAAAGDLRGTRTEGLTVHGRIHYFIDEAHLAFNKADWQKFGRPAMFYLSQHRHFGHDITLITQSVTNIDPQFRKLGESLTIMDNKGQQTALGFKLPRTLKATTYGDCQRSRPFVMSMRKFKIEEEGYHMLYSTAGGTGLPGDGVADIGVDKRKGLSFKWAVIAGVGIFVGALTLPSIVGKLSTRMVQKAIVQPAVKAGGGVGGEAVGSRSDSQYPPGVRPPAVIHSEPVRQGAGAPGTQAAREGIYLTALTAGMRTNTAGVKVPFGMVAFSDGVVVNLPSPRVPVINRDFVVRQDAAGPVVVSWYVGPPNTAPYADRTAPKFDVVAARGGVQAGPGAGEAGKGAEPQGTGYRPQFLGLGGAGRGLPEK